ncbi:MAG TPA: GNAT family N-acetyltransferase [Candidatus Dormibacteraeota bacterium]
MRPADRDRVVEMTSDIWDGDDYIPDVFDEWVADASAAFQAAEVEGVVVGLHRIRPYAPGLVWYEGLRVATSHQRQGIARAMLDSAIAEVREQGYAEIRLATFNEGASRLFRSAGFQPLVDIRWWMAPRVEGGEPAQMPDATAAEKLWPVVASSPGLELYHGISADLNGARDLGAAELGRLAGEGMLRVAPGGRALAGLRESWGGKSVPVAFLAGRGAALRDLLFALRYEADADGLERVTIAVPRGHPAADDLNASGYDLANAEDTAFIYGRKLS